MKKVIVLSFTIVLAITATGQKNSNVINPEIKKEITTNISYTYKADNLSAKESIIQMNRKKSQDLISIKAYRKATQLRSKKIRVC